MDEILSGRVRFARDSSTASAGILTISCCRVRCSRAHLATRPCVVGAHVEAVHDCWVWTKPGDRTGDMAGVAIYFVIALTLCTVLLLTELRGYQKLRAPVIGVQCAVLASLVFAFSVSYQGLWSLFWNAAPLLIMWQLPTRHPERTSPR